MQRWFRLSALLLACILSASMSFAQKPRAQVSDRVGPNEVRIFLQDSIYQISGTYMIAGTLIIEPGTEVVFLDNGRIIDSVGGRIIADGRMAATYNGTNPASLGLLQYNDPRYFLSSSVVSEQAINEPTVDPAKYDYIFNVVLDTATKNIVNLTSPNVSTQTGTGVRISPMRAMMWKAARLNSDDDIIRFQQWRRLFGVTPSVPVNLGNRRIVFHGQPQNNYSREWGHIIVLPGARAAYFRDCDFRDFRKDTTVDNRPIYDTARLAQSEKLRYMKLNLMMNRLTNGAGGALTSFASRTWLVDCNFRNNMARYRGGALQLLQAPMPDSADIVPAYRVYPDTAGLQVGYYPWVDKNPNLTEADGTPIQQNVVQLDELDRNVSEPAVANDDSRRQMVDDSRLAIFAGRIRRLTFENNKALLSAVDTLRIGGNRVLTDTNKAYGLFDDTKWWKNEAFGGAVFISGRELDENRKIEIGLGINDSIRVATGPFGFRSFGAKDFVVFNNNTAINRQLHPNSRGARGGALFIGNYTSMIINGSFRSNSTQTPYQGQYNIDRYSLGGAIYHAQTLGRLQLRGHPTLATEFIGNSAGSGGAVYVHGNTDPRPSPIVGGSDVPNPRLRDYGRRISFEDNRADAHGGAIYTNRNMTVYGAGGFINDLPLAQAYGPGFSVRFTNNNAGYSGGAIAIHLPSIEPPVPIEQRYIRMVRAEFKNNTVGNIPATASLEVRKSVRGGGAIYSMNGDLNVVKGCEFNGNRALNGNGGAIAMIHPRTSSKRFFITDADQINVLPNGVATDFFNTDSLFTNQRVTAVAADVRMLTRFYNNVAEPNPDSNLLGSGTTQMGLNKIDILRFHPGFIRDVLGNGMRENGVGLGGAIYILDSVTQERRNRRDSVYFNRVRIQNNTAFTGAAVYSDNFDLSLVMFRSLITSNKATSPIGRTQDFVRGPYIKPDNPASSDLAGAVIYGEFAGPLPWNRYSVAANSIYDNDARFIVRLPDAPDSKGTLSGGAGIGKGTTVSMMGNYWGKTEANVNTIMPNNQPGGAAGQAQETFFLQGNGKTHMQFIRNAAQRTSPTQQGPFEQNGFPGYTYTPIQVGLIPDTLLMEGRIYDLFDKGTDIKTADYSNRRMSPIEDFAVGIPPKLRRYQDPTKQSWGSYVRRTTRDPNYTDSLNYATGLENNLWRQIGRLQGEFALDQRIGEYTHAIGYPLFLESVAQYDGEDPNLNNDDPYSLNETAFIVINDSTGDYIRVNLRQLTDIPVQNNLGKYPRELFRGRVDFVMDSAARTGVSARVRRTYEGLYNFGGSESLLPRLADSANNEDISALGGRRYELAMSPELNRRGIRYNYQNQAVVYGNRPKMPASLAGGAGNADTIVSYFAGERWNALPVRPGDFIRVVSRTALWKEGVDSALQRGLSFRISNSIAPPVFTGSKIQTENPKVSPQYKSTFKDKITVNEDIDYNRPDDSDPRTRDSIFVITAIDSNMFYDPRWALDLNRPLNDSTFKFYNQLEYFWYPLYVSPFGDTIKDTDPSNKLTGLRRWVKADTIWPSMTPNPYYGATGYVVLKGKPTNPYVVPGGEWMEVVAKNWSPGLRTVDALKNIKGKPADSAFIADTLSKFIYLYQSYFHAQQYDDVILSQPGNARYLNQDTIDFGYSDSSRYKFMIFVADSIPQFTQSTGKSEGCNPPEPGTLVANVTDKLRFQVDFDTDDELEDRDAETLENWDFRFGRTSYGFLAKSIRTNPADTSTDELYQMRPNWMADRYMFKDSSDTAADSLAVDFTTKGMLNVRIPRANAIDLLTPAFSGDRAHRALNVDTLITLVVNDGHSGINYQTRKVFVNVSPEITTQSLPKAKEGTDYNPTLLDRDRRITYYDPNFGQAQNFKLLYADSPEDSIEKDPCFLEAGYWNVKDLKKTPKWLQINPVSGALYGTPGVKDAPRKIDPYNNPDTVTVVLTDAGGLTDVKTFILEVDSLNHIPRLLSAPIVRCVADGDPYLDTLKAEDIDLLRDMPVAGRETITFSIISPTGTNLEIVPSSITGPTDSVQKIVIRSNGGIDLKSIPADSIKNGKLNIRIQITDGEETRFLEYTIAVSEPTDFTVPITVRNNEQIDGLQVLTFGTARNATVGEFGGQQDAKLDSNYCEYELPPLPPRDAFDARWTIAKTNGILRNIFPTAVPKDSSVAIYKARFQAGNLTGSGTAAYPVEISWNTDDVPGRNEPTRNPAGSSWHIRDAVAAGAHFDYNMKLAIGRHAATCDFKQQGSICTITIYQDIIDGFIIYYDFVSDVNEPVPGLPSEVSISENTPNPFNATTQFNIAIPSTANVTVGMYDALGHLVKVIAGGTYQPGTYTLAWDGKGQHGEDLAAGVYLCKMSVNGTNVTRPMMLVR